MFGLLDSDIISIKNVLEKHPEVKPASIFGSRAKGNCRNVTFLNEETLMPYQFDVLDYAAIQAEQLVDHIDRMGILFYEKV